ncbi:hypothetical protein CP8484711_1847A, partial [Chlamydia psittaci 84-8471/1]
MSRRFNISIKIKQATSKSVLALM